MSVVAYLLGAAVCISGSAADPLQVGSAVLTHDDSADPVAAFPHTDFGRQSVDDHLVGLGGPSGLEALADPTLSDSLPLEDHVPLMRRDALFTQSPRSQIMADEISRSRDVMGSDSESEQDERAPHKYMYQENPSYTPEAIFGNKRIAPEIAEFLGHLAQKTRVHHKEVNKAARQAGLISQGSGKTISPGDEDDSDDIEDMKRAAASQPKSTPLAHFMERLDAKTTAASWSASDCAALSKNVTEKYLRMSGRSLATWGTAGPAGAAGRSEIHTGMFFRHWGLDKDVMKTAARKFRLGVLSFLATQDAARVKLHIWTDLESPHNTLKEMLGPIAHHAELMDAINITTFDPKVEFAKVPPSLAKETLSERYKKDTMPSLRSDLYRSVILYNYGGLWMDADTVLMQDVAPLLGEDWAYLVRGKEGAVEGALLSASRPKSHFANAYLIQMVMREPPLDSEMEKQKPLLVEIFNNDPAHTSMHVLPPCFIDSDPAPPSIDGAVLSSDTSLGSDFFGKAVAMPYRAYFSMGIQEAVKDNSTAEVSVLQDPSFAQPSGGNEDEDESAPTSPSWAYHWRGNFGASWARGSLADVAERTFMKKLQLKMHH